MARPSAVYLAPMDKEPINHESEVSMHPYEAVMRAADQIEAHPDLYSLHAACVPTDPRGVACLLGRIGAIAGIGLGLDSGVRGPAMEAVCEYLGIEPVAFKRYKLIVGEFEGGGWSQFITEVEDFSREVEFFRRLFGDSSQTMVLAEMPTAAASMLRTYARKYLRAPEIDSLVKKLVRRVAVPAAVALAAILVPHPAPAQTASSDVVLACPGWWGVSGGISTSCTGCSKPIWTKPDANDPVKTDGNQYWKALGQLKPTDHVITNTGKAEGSLANCADSTNVVKTVSQIYGTTTTPPPPPPPTTSDPPGTLIWTTPTTQCADGTPITNCAISGYRIEYGQTDFSKAVLVDANTLKYTLTGLAVGTWQARVVSISTDSTGKQYFSLPSNSVSFQITTPPPAPVFLTLAGPVFEAVLPLTGTALVKGNQEGTIIGGKTCGTEIFLEGTTSYRNILEADAALASPTYRGRQHVAACASVP